MTTKDLGVVTTTAAKSPPKICQTATPASGGHALDLVRGIIVL